VIHIKEVIVSSVIQINYPGVLFIENKTVLGISWFVFTKSWEVYENIICSHCKCGALLTCRE